MNHIVLVVIWYVLTLWAIYSMLRALRPDKPRLEAFLVALFWAVTMPVFGFAAWLRNRKDAS